MYVLSIREKADKILDRSSWKAQNLTIDCKVSLVDAIKVQHARLAYTAIHVCMHTRTYVHGSYNSLSSCTFHIHFCVYILYVHGPHTYVPMYVTIFQYSSTLLKGVERGIPSIQLIASFVCG